MTEFLVKHFVKDYERVEDPDVRTGYGVLSGAVGLFCNVLLFAVKLVSGLAMHSLAIMADAFNNLSDAASSVVSFIGVRMANKPADQEHPFGHGRLEYVSALIVSFLVLDVGLSLFRSSLEKLREPEEIVFSWPIFLLLVLSMGVKLWMGLFNRKLGRRISSKVMMAAAADSLGDLAATGAAVLSLLVCHLTSVNIDAAAGLLVSLAVMWAGVGITRDTLEPLIGQRADPELARRIVKLVESFDGIAGTHDLVIHNYGPGRSMATIHAEVPKDMSIEASHAVIDRAEREAARQLNLLLVIHTDPVELHDARVLAVREKLQNVITALDPGLSFHDFQVEFGEEEISLIFDLKVPFSYTPGDQERTMHQIMTLMQEVDPRYQCLITLDQGYLPDPGKGRERVEKD